MSLSDVEGWATVSGDAVSRQVPAGVGLAEHVTGESYYLKASGNGCLADGNRHVLVFRDEDLFREFRQGRLPGSKLEQVRASADGRLMAFRFQPRMDPQLVKMPLDGCGFVLHRDLERALVAEPSRTEGLVDEDAVDVDDN